VHLNGLAGNDGVLLAATIERLHTPPEVAGPDKMGYAGGWLIKGTENLGVIHYHAGSAGTFYALIELYPEHRRAIVCAMNVGPDGAAVAESISRMINERKGEEAQSRR
jgi:L-ascorbate metabolism protein UlaG (beta-lactamase superfamily)